MSSSKQHIR